MNVAMRRRKKKKKKNIQHEYDEEDQGLCCTKTSTSLRHGTEFPSSRVKVRHEDTQVVQMLFWDSEEEERDSREFSSVLM